MKNLILLVCAVFALTTVSVAQNTPAAQAPAKGKEMKAKGKEHGQEMKTQGQAKAKEAGEKGKAQGEQGKGMGANLGLSTDQQTQYGAINKAHQEAVKKVQMDAALSGEAKKAQVNALKSKYEADLKGIMTAEQFTKWSEKRAERAAEKGANKVGEYKDGAKQADDEVEGAQNKMKEHKDDAKKMGDKKPKVKTDKAPPQGLNRVN
jgi:hypothetical protein